MMADRKAPRFVTVLRGGPSAEREVSLRSGAAVAKGLSGLGYTVTEVDPKPGAWSLPDPTDMVFLALHGSYGEDGAIQAELEEAGIPYTGSDAVSSQIAFNKALTKRRFSDCGLLTPDYEVLESSDAPWPANWSPPVVLKPVCQGSSVGLEILEDTNGWSLALGRAFRYGDSVLMEERVLGREVTVGIVDGDLLPVVEVRPHEGTYDYKHKYTSGATEYLCPAPFPEEVLARISDAGREAFRAIGGRHFGRVDLIVREDGTPYLLEVNTLPGLTENSLLPKAAAAVGIAFPALCERILMAAWRDAWPSKEVPE